MRKEATEEKRCCSLQALVMRLVKQVVRTAYLMYGKS